MRYTCYLHSLAVLYMLTAVPILVNITVHAGFLKSFSLHYLLLLYFAHFELYLINVLLFSDNLLVDGQPCFYIHSHMYRWQR